MIHTTMSHGLCKNPASMKPRSHSEARALIIKAAIRWTRPCQDQILALHNSIKIFFSRFSLVLKASKKHRIVEKCFKKSFWVHPLGRVHPVLVKDGIWSDFAMESTWHGRNDPWLLDLDACPTSWARVLAIRQAHA
jgi:hypothetical protein